MDGIAWAGSAMVAARSRLEIATENLANVSTNGFRRIDAHGFLTALGVSVSRRRASEQGALRRTDRDFDLALVGPGSFRVRGGTGRIVESRDGAFTRERNGTLCDMRGRTLQGMHGALRVADGAHIDSHGRVLLNGRAVDAIAVPAGTSVQSGFLESAGVDAIGQMIDVLSAERSFESAEKVVAAIDATREKSSDTARVK